MLSENRTYTDEEIMLDHELEFFKYVENLTVADLAHRFSLLETLGLIGRLADLARAGYVHRERLREHIRESSAESRAMIGGILHELLRPNAAEAKVAEK